MATTVGTLLVNVIGNASGLASTLSAAENAVSKFGAGTARMGSRWTAGISLPIAGLLTSIARVGVKFDDEMSKSVAIMDDVDATMRRKMENTAMDLSKKLRFSSTEIAAGYYDLASAGFSAEGALDNIGTVATFAQAGMMKMEVAGEHLAGAVKSLSKELIGAETDAGAMAKVADVLTSANNHALGTVEDFSQALTTRFASGMKSVNMSLEEGVGFLMAFAQQNIKGKEASQQAWMALRDVQSATIRSGAAWQEYGISVYDANEQMRDMPDILDQINLRMKGFSKGQVKDWLETGVMPETPEGPAMSDKARRQMLLDLKLPDRSVTALQKVLGESDQIRTFTELLKNSMGEADRVAAKQGESIAARWEMMMHRIQNAGIRLVLGNKEVVADLFVVMNSWVDKLDEVVNWFVALDAPTRQWYMQLTAITVAAGPVLWFLGTFISLGSQIIGVVNGMTKILAPFIGGMTRLLGASASAASASSGWATFSAKFGAMATTARAAFGTFLTAATYFGVLYAIFDGSIRPMFSWLLNNLGRVDALFGGMGSTIVALAGKMLGALGSWDEWKKTLGYFINVIGNVWKTVQFGWRLIPELFVVIAEVAKDGVTSVINDVWDLVRSFQQMWGAIVSFIRNIPILGDVLAGVFAFSKLLFGELWNVIKFVFKGIVDGAAYVGKALYNALAPQWLKESVSWMYGLATGTETIHDAARNTSDAFDEWLLSIGAVDVKAKSLTGTMESLKGVMTRTGRDIDPSSMPRIPGAAGPATPPPAGTTKRDPVQEAFGQLMGDGGRQWRDVAKAVAEHRKEIFSNAEAMDRLWEIYKGVRLTVGQTGLTKELDELFADRIAMEDMERISAAFGDMFNDLFNNGETQTLLEKNLSLIGNYVRERQALLADAGDAGGGIFTPEFFKKYGADIEQLNKHYGSQSTEVKILIDEYYKWINALEASERAVSDAAKANEALTSIVVTHADMTAKLADAQREFSNLQLTEGERTIRGMSRNMEQQSQAFDEENAKMLDSMKYLEGEKLKTALDTFSKIKAQQKEFLQLTLDSDIYRAASAVGVDAKILRSFKHMSEEKRKEMVKERVASNQLAQNYRDMGSALSDIASVTDEGGNKTITWLADMVTLLGDATDTAAGLKESMAAIGSAQEAGDWAGMISGAISFFQQIAKGIVIMDKATQSASRMQATIGGASSGAQMGAAFGPWGALIGGIGGGIFGFIRSGNRAVEEARKKMQELQKSFADTMKEFADAHPEIKSLDRIMRAFGVTLGTVNSEADLERVREELRRFEEQLEGVRGKFEDLLSQANDLGIGMPSEIEDAVNQLVEMGIITGSTAEMWGKMLGSGEVSWTKMKEAADRIGLAEDKLGKGYQQAKMNSVAKQLINDVDILERGGAASADILEAIKDEVNALVIDSMKFGTTIPENMRPWIEALIANGQLLDANGQKIENLDGINFGPSIKTQFEEITTALKELIEELKKLPGLFAGLGGRIPTPTMPEVPSGEITPPGEDPRGGGDGRTGDGEKTPRTSGASMAASNAAITAGRTGTAAGLSASTAGGGRPQTNVIVLPVAVGDATSIEDLADLAVARLPENIADNTGNIKYAIISAARATSVPRSRS